MSLHVSYTHKQNSSCQCEQKQQCQDDLLSEFCVKCGRIWYNTLDGNFRPTEMFHPIKPKPLGGVWIGHTFIEGLSLPKRMKIIG